MSSKKGLLLSVVVLASLAGAQVSAEGAVSDTSTPIINTGQPTDDTTTPNVTPTPETPSTDVETPSTDVTTPETPVNPDQGTNTDTGETTNPTTPEKPNIPGEEGTPNTDNQNPSKPSEGKEEEKPTNPSTDGKGETTPSTDGNQNKPSTPSTDGSKPNENNKPEVIVPRTTNPVVTETGDNIVGTQNGYLVLDNGVYITPESIGGRTNSDNTVTVKNESGKEVTLPSTNTVNSSILTGIGEAILSLLVLFSYFGYSDKTKSRG